MMSGRESNSIIDVEEADEKASRKNRKRRPSENDSCKPCSVDLSKRTKRFKTRESRKFSILMSDHVVEKWREKTKIQGPNLNLLHNTISEQLKITYPASSEAINNFTYERHHVVKPQKRKFSIHCDHSRLEESGCFGLRATINQTPIDQYVPIDSDNKPQEFIELEVHCNQCLLNKEDLVNTETNGSEKMKKKKLMGINEESFADLSTQNGRVEDDNTNQNIVQNCRNIVDTSHYTQLYSQCQETIQYLEKNVEFLHTLHKLYNYKPIIFVVDTVSGPLYLEINGTPIIFASDSSLGSIYQKRLSGLWDKLTLNKKEMWHYKKSTSDDNKENTLIQDEGVDQHGNKVYGSIAYVPENTVLELIPSNDKISARIEPSNNPTMCFYEAMRIEKNFHESEQMVESGIESLLDDAITETERLQCKSNEILTDKIVSPSARITKPLNEGNILNGNLNLALSTNSRNTTDSIENDQCDDSNSTTSFDSYETHNKYEKMATNHLFDENLCGVRNAMPNEVSDVQKESVKPNSSSQSTFNQLFNVIEQHTLPMNYDMISEDEDVIEKLNEDGQKTDAKPFTCNVENKNMLMEPPSNVFFFDVSKIGQTQDHIRNYMTINVVENRVDENVVLNKNNKSKQGGFTKHEVNNIESKKLLTYLSPNKFLSDNLGVSKTQHQINNHITIDDHSKSKDENEASEKYEQKKAIYTKNTDFKEVNLSNHSSPSWSLNSNEIAKTHDQIINHMNINVVAGRECASKKMIGIEQRETNQFISDHSNWFSSNGCIENVQTQDELSNHMILDDDTEDEDVSEESSESEQEEPTSDFSNFKNGKLLGTLSSNNCLSNSKQFIQTRDQINNQVQIDDYSGSESINEETNDNNHDGTICTEKRDFKKKEFCDKVKNVAGATNGTLGILKIVNINGSPRILSPSSAKEYSLHNKAVKEKDRTSKEEKIGDDMEHNRSINEVIDLTCKKKRKISDNGLVDNRKMTDEITNRFECDETTKAIPENPPIAYTVEQLAKIAMKSSKEKALTLDEFIKLIKSDDKRIGVEAAFQEGSNFGGQTDIQEITSIITNKFENTIKQLQQVFEQRFTAIENELKLNTN